MPDEMAKMFKNLRMAWLITKKDLTLEARRKYELFSMFSFAILSIFCLSFAVSPLPAYAIDIVPSILWVIILFVGMFSFTTVFVREMDTGTIDGLRSLPMAPQVILLGKTLFSFITMGLVEVLLIPLSMAFFNYSFKSSLLLSLAVFLVGTLNIALMGSMISAVTMYTESRALVIPLLTFPLTLGTLMPSITATMKLMKGVTVTGLAPELRLMGAFFLTVLLLSWLTFSEVFFE